MCHWRTVIARSTCDEAIHPSVAAPWIASLALAMTVLQLTELVFSSLKNRIGYFSTARPEPPP
jgi:hypothetical protein